VLGLSLAVYSSFFPLLFPFLFSSEFTASSKQTALRASRWRNVLFYLFFVAFLRKFLFSTSLSSYAKKNNEKNGFVTVTKLGTTNNFFVAATKNFAAATKRFVDITKHFVVVTKYFCYPYFNK